MLVHQSDATSEDKYRAIYGVIRRIPAGKVASYGQVAAIAGLPGRARLVGKALGAALNQYEVPWYRVLRSDGKIAFAAETESAHRQRELLRAEEVEVINNRVNLGKYGWEPEPLW